MRYAAILMATLGLACATYTVEERHGLATRSCAAVVAQDDCMHNVMEAISRWGYREMEFSLERCLEFYEPRAAEMGDCIEAELYGIYLKRQKTQEAIEALGKGLTGFSEGVRAATPPPQPQPRTVVCRTYPIVGTNQSRTVCR